MLRNGDRVALREDEFDLLIEDRLKGRSEIEDKVELERVSLDPVYKDIQYEQEKFSPKVPPIGTPSKPLPGEVWINGGWGGETYRPSVIVKTPRVVTPPVIYRPGKMPGEAKGLNLIDRYFAWINSLF